MLKKLLLALAVLMVIAGCQSPPERSVAIDNSLESESQGTVVMLHGLWRNNRAMRPVESYVRALGYDVVNISYPSTEFDIPTLVEDYILPEVEYLADEPGEVHFVTHSMGGILVRYLMQEHPMDNLGRVVMLAPPNKGSELVDSTSNFFDASPAALQLSSAESSWVNQLSPIDFEVGIIAGDKNNNLVTGSLLPGPDDGVVTVASTQLSNMRDFMTVPLKHYHLRSNPFVLQQVAYFIQYGEFFRE